MNLVAAVRGLQERRLALVAEIDTIDRELAEARELLVGPARAPEAPAPAVAVPEPVSRQERRALIVEWLRKVSGFMTVPDLMRIDGLDGVSLSTIKNDLQELRRLGLVSVDHEGWRAVTQAAVVAPVPAPRTLADVVKTVAPVVPPPPLRMHDLPAASLPERRCGRCLHKFKPADSRQYVCSGCEKPAKSAPRTTTDDGAELETVWTPGKDAPSLTGDAEGLGSTLAGSDFKVHR